MIMRGVQDPEERDERVKHAYMERLLSVILWESQQAQILVAAGHSDIAI